jgi:hypothetical protein
MGSDGPDDPVSAWAEELFGEDAEEIQAVAEQIVEDHGMSLHVAMVIPVSAAREWLEHYENSLNGAPESMAKMLMFLEQFAVQIEHGLDMDVDPDYIDDDEEDGWSTADEWGFG